jgi:hypothetical protein
MRDVLHLINLSNDRGIRSFQTQENKVPIFVMPAQAGIHDDSNLKARFSRIGKPLGPQLRGDNENNEEFGSGVRDLTPWPPSPRGKGGPERGPRGQTPSFFTFRQVHRIGFET